MRCKECGREVRENDDRHWYEEHYPFGESYATQDVTDDPEFVCDQCGETDYVFEDFDDLVNDADFEEILFALATRNTKGYCRAIELIKEKINAN
jgi:hypothetical protein